MTVGRVRVVGVLDRMSVSVPSTAERVEAARRRAGSQPQRRLEVKREGWMVNAACRDAPVELFFPGRGEMGVVNDAKRVCESCAVRAECLDYALRVGERHGVWGGLSERERRRLRSARRAS